MTILKLADSNGGFYQLAESQVYRHDNCPGDDLKVHAIREHQIEFTRKNKSNVVMDFREFVKSARLVEHLSGSTSPAPVTRGPERRKHSHYFKSVAHLDTIDVYRVLDLFNVEDQTLGHAIKKLLVAGGRGAGKDFRKDVQEAIDTLQRRLDMLDEDGHVST